MGNSAQKNQNDPRAAERAKVLKKHEFTITEELRRGISGRVFLVKNPDEDYFVVKEINYRESKDFNRDAVRNEINILKKLHHGYIVGYKDSFEDEESGYFYIVSEYCAGGDLYKKMKEQENKHLPFEEEQIIDWFVQICLALQHLHKKNILHRDVKPQNVFLTEDGYINLGDFGCSKVLQSADEYATSVVGADLYISPEICERRHNSKSDIWSLGWVLHDLCMLDVWSNFIERRCLHAISLKGTIPTISNMYSEDLKELISQMLSRDPHERPSADEILAKPFLEDAVKRNRRIPDALKQLLEKHEYTIIEELGLSGIAFLVNSPEGEPYVVKEISYKNETDLDEIKEEVKILRSLNHPCIVDYEETFEDQATGHVYIVMEYCAGGDLYKKMQAEGNNGVFEEQQILDWFVQICLALQHLHKKNILHRDIKPQNVFLTEDGCINLSDFGCSKVLRSADVYANSVVGSNLYVSPEVLAHRCDFKSDIWSLGWLLHDLCMLNMWSDIIERRCAHASSLNGAPPQISERYSEELRKLIRQMLSCDPNRRPSAAEILAKPFLREAVKRNKRIPVTLKQRFMKTTEIFAETFEDFNAFLNEWKEIIDSLEEIHRKCTIGSLSGSVIGAAGGITALVGAILIPFTFGASLIVSGVGVGVGVAGGVTSAASNITNSVQQKALNERLDKIRQNYKNVNQHIFNSSGTLRLLRKIQKFRSYDGCSMFDNIQDPWWVDRNTFTSWHAIKLINLCVLENLKVVQAGVQALRAGVQAGTQSAVKAGTQAGVQAGAQAGVQAVRAGVQAGTQSAVKAGTQAGVQASVQAGVQAGAQAGVQASFQASVQASVQAGVQAGAQAGVQASVQAGVQTGVQAARAGRAAAAATEAVVAMAAVSGVLSGLLVIVDGVFIGIDSREIHQMRQGELNDPEKVKSSVLKGIAQMRKMHKELDNILEGIKETRVALNRRI